MSGLPGVLILPIAGALFGAAGAWLLPSRLRPAVATRIVTTFVVLSAVAVLWSLVLVTFASMIEIHGIAERIPWCHGYFQTHSDRPSLIGALSAIFLAASVTAGARAARCHRRLRAHDSDGGIAVVLSPNPTAFALPGRPGQIVVSRSMLQLLDGDERRALLAHERAHLDLHHHRYLRAAELAAAFLPILRPLVNRVRLATERWADEEAAIQVGDRRVVARASPVPRWPSRRCSSGCSGCPIAVSSSGSRRCSSRLLRRGVSSRAPSRSRRVAQHSCSCSPSSKCTIGSRTRSGSAGSEARARIFVPTGVAATSVPLCATLSRSWLRSSGCSHDSV